MQLDLCPLCERIKELREEQGKDFFQDLCVECKEKYLLVRR